MTNQGLTGVELAFHWVSFNVLVALFPLMFGMLALWTRIWGDGSIRLDWTLLKDGELFFFASTLSATAIGNTVKLYFESAPLRAYSFSTMVALIIMLLFSSIAFGGLLRDKFESSRRPTMDFSIPDRAHAIGKLSSWTAAGAVLLAFIAAYQGRFE